MKPLHDRIMGCIIGGAVGDYIGAPLEGRAGPIEVAVPATSEITDDTQLTLATCEAIVRAGRPDPESIAHTFGDWFSRRRISGIGSSTLKALRDISFGAHWALAGASGEMSAGNGAAMRIAPLAFCTDPTSPEGRRAIKDVSSVTHRNDEAFTGALAIALAIANPGFDFIPAVLNALPDSNTADKLRTLASDTNASVTELGIRYGARGYVAESVPLALIAASRGGQSGFQDAVFSIITCGGDTDTTGSMVGQIVGSKVGLSAIPKKLISLPFGREPVRRIAEEFADWVEKNTGSRTR
jgi:ADP-ribosylglycohydrolase